MYEMCSQNLSYFGAFPIHFLTFNISGKILFFPASLGFILCWEVSQDTGAFQHRNCLAHIFHGSVFLGARYHSRLFIQALCKYTENIELNLYFSVHNLTFFLWMCSEDCKALLIDCKYSVYICHKLIWNIVELPISELALKLILQITLLN